MAYDASVLAETSTLATGTAESTTIAAVSAFNVFSRAMVVRDEEAAAKALVDDAFRTYREARLLASKQAITAATVVSDLVYSLPNNCRRRIGRSKGKVSSDSIRSGVDDHKLTQDIASSMHSLPVTRQ